MAKLNEPTVLFKLCCIILPNQKKSVFGKEKVNKGLFEQIVFDPSDPFATTTKSDE